MRFLLEYFKRTAYTEVDKISRAKYVAPYSRALSNLIIS